MNKKRSECKSSTENKRRENDNFNLRTRYYKHADNTQKHNKNSKI